MSTSPRRGNIANRYLQNLSSESPRSSSSRIASLSNKPLRENLNLVNSSRTPSAALKPNPNSSVLLSRSSTISELDTENVTGLRGRKKLAKKNSDEHLNASWADHQRHDLQGYEYLCRVGEAKHWIERCINEELPSEAELCSDGFRDGVILAKLTQAFVPELVKKIVPSSKRLQFKHTENINNFFKFLDIVGIPDLFRFELTDLYDKKNIPKVIFCIHALSYLLAQDERAPQMTDLVGKLEFTEEEISASQKALDGANLPNFSSVKKDQNGKPMPPSSSSSSSSSSSNDSPSNGRAKNNKFGNGNNARYYNDYDDDDEEYNYSRRNKTKSPKRHLPPVPEPIVEVEPEEPEDPEPSNEELELMLKSVIKFQSLARGSLFRYKMFVQKMVLKANEPIFVQLQSIIRASSLRNGPLITELMMKSATPSMIELQSIIRGAITRKYLRHSVKKIYKRNGGHIVTLQSIIRGNLARDRLLDHLDSLIDAGSQDPMVRLQAVIRKILYNKKATKYLRKAYKAESSITELQSILRGVLVRKALVTQLKTLDYSSSPIIRLQALIRGKLFRESHEANLSTIKEIGESMILFQSKIRAVLYKRKMFKLSALINKSRSEIIELQSIARGGVARNNLNVVLDTLDLCESKVSKFNALIRGKQYRQELAEFKKELHEAESETIEVQSLIRGLLGRFSQDILLDDLEDNEDSVINVQAAIRGLLVRKANRERDAYYLANIDKIIKIQSFIKGKDFGDAYRKLITMKNPPLSVISKFAHLLNDTEKDFQDEIYLNQLNEKILYKTRETENLEQTNKELDIKIALLVKNKSTLDELIRLRNNGYSGYKVEMDPSIGQVDINSLNKSTRQRVEIYQKVFYLLQTQPRYFITIADKFEFSNISLKDLQNSILKVFNYGGCGLNTLTTKRRPRSHSPTRKVEDENLHKASKREEFMFIRFLSEMIGTAIEKAADFDEFATNYVENTSALWQKLFNAFIRTNTQKNTLKNLFGSLISSISDIDELSLESNPLKIYQSILEGEGKPSRVNISVEESIQKPKVRTQFVKNLAQLRELSNNFVELFNEKVDQFPDFVKALMSSMYTKLKVKFPEITDKLALSISGYILVDLYMNSIICHPENYGITLTTLNSRTTIKLKENLLEITKLLSQMVLMAPFPIEEVYLQPLNDYIESQSDLVERTLRKLTRHPDIERLYGISVLNDLSNYKKPTLLIEVDELTNITKLISENNTLFDENDVIQEYLLELTELTKNARNLKLAIGSKELKLTLTPTVKDVPGKFGSKTNTLLIQAKRCVIYMMQVQNGRNLLDLLLSKIKPDDELKFAQIIEDENKEKIEKSMYTNAQQGSLGDLSKMTYHDLKCLALEKILELETMGILSRSNNFQQLVNEIAHDIRAKKDQRSAKQQQIYSAELVLKGVEDKEQRLKKLLDVYNDYISKTVASLQSKPDQRRKKKLFPFISKQYFYQKQLRRQGKTPKFGSYKYGARYLYDQGILAELKGVKGQELPKVDLMFSCDEVGVFLIEAASGSIPIPNAVAKLSLDDLLFTQYENNEYVEIYDGIVKFHTDTFLNFIFKKFYDNSA